MALKTNINSTHGHGKYEFAVLYQVKWARGSRTAGRKQIASVARPRGVFPMASGARPGWFRTFDARPRAGCSGGERRAAEVVRRAAGREGEGKRRGRRHGLELGQKVLSERFFWLNYTTSSQPFL